LSSNSTWMNLNAPNARSLSGNHDNTDCCRQQHALCWCW
jgi:hypothetical protein